MENNKRTDGGSPAHAAPAESNDPRPAGPNSNTNPSPAAAAANQASTPAPPAAQPSQPSQPSQAGQATPSQAALAADPHRTHRTWTPKYGRVQKCDWCNNRADGILMVCGHSSGCAARMCQDCAKSRIWHSNPAHFIDAAALDWTVRRAPRAKQVPKKPKGPKAPKAAKKAPAKRPATASPSDEPARPAARRSRLARDDSPADGDGHFDNDRANLPDPHPPHAQFPAPSFADHDGGRPFTTSSHYGYYQGPAPPYQAAYQGGYYAQPGSMQQALGGYHAPPPPTMPAPPRPHHPAGRPGFGMGSMFYGHANVDEEEDGHFNDPGRRHGNHPAGHPAAFPGPRSRTEHGFAPSPFVAPAAPLPARSPLAAPSPLAAAWDPQPPHPIVPGSGEQDALVVDVHHWLYGYRPYLDPHRRRTEIPGSLHQGGAQQHGLSAGHPHHDKHQQNPTSPPAHAHGQNPYAAAAAADRHRHHDAQLARELPSAWADHPALAALRSARRELEALAALWAVYELRRDAIPLLGPADRTVRWFVHMREFHLRQRRELEEWEQREREQWEQQRARWEVMPGPAPVAEMGAPVVSVGGARVEGGREEVEEEDGGGATDPDETEEE